MPIPLLASTTAGPFISAHRGYSSDFPENTLPALEAALEAGADVAEIDVRLTRDGKLVLMHDATVDRTTDGSGPVSAMTLEEVRTLDAGRGFDRKFAGTPVPTLDEVLAWSNGRLGILVEMKNYPEREPAFIEEMIAAIKRNKAEEFAFPAGFDHVSLAEIHRRQPAWRLEMILHCRLADHVHAARAAGAVLVSHEPEYCVKSDVEEMHAAGIAVLCTLRSVEHGRELLETGVDIFEADDVRLSRDALRQLGRR
jgi:glycerophosphoryl diester phosphodiesterase